MVGRRSFPFGMAQPGRCELLVSGRENIYKYNIIYLDMGVSKNNGIPKSSIFSRVFHYFHHPFWGNYHHFWKHPGPYIYIYTYIPKGSLGRTWLIFLDMFRYRSGFFLASFNSKAGFRLNHPVKV